MINDYKNWVLVFVVPPSTTIKMRKKKSSVVGPSALFVFGIFAPPNNKIRDKKQSKIIIFSIWVLFLNL